MAISRHHRSQNLALALCIGGLTLLLCATASLARAESRLAGAPTDTETLTPRQKQQEQPREEQPPKPQQQQETEQLATSCLRELNAHLAKHLGSGLGTSEPEVAAAAAVDPESVRAALAKVLRHLELARQNPELVIVGAAGETQSQTDCTAEALRALAQSLHEASAPAPTCDQPALDLLMIVANYKLAPVSSSSLLNEFARARVDACWQAYVSSVSRGLDRVLGKMGGFVFSFLEGVARAVRHLEEEQTRAAEGRAANNEIRINEQRARDVLADEFAGAGGAPYKAAEERTSLDSRRQPEALREALGALKQVKVDSEPARWLLVRALNELYEVRARKLRSAGAPEEPASEFYEHFFARPCGQLVERVQGLLAHGAIYRNHLRQTLGQALAEEKRANLALDYQLQMFRICKLAGQQSASLAGKLVDLRRNIDFQLGSKFDY